LSSRNREIGLVFVVIGLGGLLTVLLRLTNPIDYLPSDVRSQAGFNEAVSAIAAGIAILSLLVGIVWLYRNRRGRD